MRIVYLIGYPGAGKTSAVRGALKLLGWEGREVASRVPTIRGETADGRTIAVLGRDRHPFGGTDTLGMAINPIACEWVKEPHDFDVLVGEGDRLANEKFLTACGARLTLVEMHLSPTEARRRARQRARENEMPFQNDTWMRGRVTKVDNLWEKMADRLSVTAVRVDAERPPDVVAADVAALLGGCVSP